MIIECLLEFKDSVLCDVVIFEKDFDSGVLFCVGIFSVLVG